LESSHRIVNFYGFGSDSPFPEKPVLKTLCALKPDKYSSNHSRSTDVQKNHPFSGRLKRLTIGVTIVQAGDDSSSSGNTITYPPTIHFFRSRFPRTGRPKSMKTFCIRIPMTNPFIWVYGPWMKASARRRLDAVDEVIGSLVTKLELATPNQHDQ